MSEHSRPPAEVCCCGNPNSHIQISTQVMGKINKEASCKKWISTCTMHTHILCMHACTVMYTCTHTNTESYTAHRNGLYKQL